MTAWPALDECPHRTVAGAIVAVEGDRAVGERRGRRDEPHDRARQSRVDDPAAQRTGRDPPAVALVGHVNAQRAQRGNHQLRVARMKRPHNA